MLTLRLSGGTRNLRVVSPIGSKIDFWGDPIFESAAETTRQRWS